MTALPAAGRTSIRSPGWRHRAFSGRNVDSAADLATIFGAAGILPEPLQKQFAPDARHQLDHLFDTCFTGGLPAVKKGTLVPIAPPPEHITDPAARPRARLADVRRKVGLGVL